MFTRLAACLSVVASAVALAPAGAQTSQKLSAQASALFVGVAGDAYRSLNNGPGIEAQIRFTPGAVSLGGGFQYSNHNIAFNGLAPDITGSVKLLGAFLEPRLVIPTGSARLAPYVSARLAYLRQTLDMKGRDGTANGYQANGGGGVLMRLSGNVNLDLGATFGYIDFTDVKSDGSTLPDPASGTNWVFRAGFAFGLGR